MKGVTVFKSLAEAVRAGYSVYDKTPTGYVVQLKTPAGMAMAIVDVTGA